MQFFAVSNPALALIVVSFGLAQFLLLMTNVVYMFRPARLVNGYDVTGWK